MCNYRGLCQQMHEKSILQISSTCRWSSYSRHVSDASGKAKEHIRNYWVSNKIKYQLNYVWSNEVVKLIKEYDKSVKFLY